MSKNAQSKQRRSSKPPDRDRRPSTRTSGGGALGVPPSSPSRKVRSVTPQKHRLSLPLVAGTGAGALLLVLLAFYFLANRPGDGATPAGPAPSSVTPVARLQSSDFHSLAVNPADPDTVWFGSHMGIQESKDGGRSWQPLGGMSGDAMSMAIPPADASRVYIAGHDVFKRSSDAGKSWQDVQTDLPGTDLHGFAADPANAEHVFALVAGQGMFESNDGGDSWQPVKAQPPGAGGALAVSWGSPPTIYAATALGVMRSTDGAASWHPANTGLPADQGGQSSVYALLAVPSQPQEAYAGTATGLYHTGNGGTTWQQVALPGQPLLALAASQSSPLRLYALAAEGALYRLEGGSLGR